MHRNPKKLHICVVRRRTRPRQDISTGRMEFQNTGFNCCLATPLFCFTAVLYTVLLPYMVCKRSCLPTRLFVCLSACYTFCWSPVFKHGCLSCASALAVRCLLCLLAEWAVLTLWLLAEGKWAFLQCCYSSSAAVSGLNCFTLFFLSWYEWRLRVDFFVLIVCFLVLHWLLFCSCLH